MRKLVYTILFVVVLILLVPTVLSTHLSVKYLVTPLFQKAAKGKVEIDSLQLSWFGSQEVHGLRWSKDNAVLFVEVMKTDANLLHPFPKSLSIKGKTELQGKQGVIDVNFDQENYLAEITDFPVEIFDPFVKSPYKPADWLGKTLNLNIFPDEDAFRLKIESEYLHADTGFQVDGEKIALSKSGKIQLNIKKDLLEGIYPKVINDTLVNIQVKDIEIENGFNTQLQVDAYCPIVQFADELTLERASFHLSMRRKKIEFDFDAIPSHSPSGKKGDLYGKGYYQHGLLIAEGKIQELPSQWTAQWLPEELSSDANLTAKINDHRLTLDYQSESLVFHDVQLLVGNQVELFKPAALQMSDGKTHYAVNLTTFKSDPFSPLPKNTDLKGSLSIPQTEAEIGRIENGLVKFEGNLAKGMKFNFYTYFIPYDGYNIIEEWKGEGQGDLVFNQDWQPTLRELKFNGRHHQSEIQLRIQQDKNKNLVGSGVVKTTLPPEQLYHDALPYQLNAPFDVRLSLNHFKVDSKLFKPVEADLNLQIGELQFGEELSPPVFVLSDISGHAKYEKEHLKGSVKAHVREGIAEGEIEISLSNLLDPFNGSGVIRGKDFPVGVFDHLFSGYSLKKVIGPYINGKILIEGNHHAALDLNNEKVHAKGSFYIDDAISLNSPLTIDWLISPETLQEFHSGYTSMQPTYLHMTVDSLKLDRQWNLDSCEMDLVLKGLKIVKEANLSTLNLDLMSSHIQYDPGNRHLDLTLDAEGSVQGKKKTPFHTHFIGTKKGDDISVKGYGNDLPIKRLAKIANVPEEWMKNINALIGSKLSFKAEADLKGWSGPFEVNLESERSYLLSECEFDQRVLRLTSPLQAELQVSQNLRGTLLTESFFFLDYVVTGNKPIKLVVNPEGAEWNTRKPWKEAMQIPDFSIDFGKLYFQNFGTMTEILGMFNIPAERSEFSVWFTPQYFTLENGKLYLKRMDALLAENYPVASWGSINLKKEQMNMKIGLTSTTLKRAFKLNGVPKDYMLQITMKGSTENPKVKHGTSARYKAFFSQFRSGIQGILINSILKVIANENKPPKPMTKPFPWKTNS